MSILQEPKKLHSITYALIWAQAILGGVLFAGCWPFLTHGIFAVLAVIALLCVHRGKTRGTRVTARVIISLFWVFALMLGVQAADAAANGFTAEYIARLQDGACWFGGPFLCYLTPVAIAAMLCHGEHTAIYDRVMGCLILPAQIGVAYVSIFTDAGIPWTMGGKFLPYVWLAVLVVTTILVWLCARIRTPAQEVPIERRRQKHADKIAARKAQK
jgi:hypothetical protein